MNGSGREKVTLHFDPWPWGHLGEFFLTKILLNISYFRWPTAVRLKVTFGSGKK